MAEIDFHASIREGALELELAESLRENRIDPKLLYVTLWQVELWRKVHQRHSPIHGNPEFVRIYREAYARVLAMLPPGKIWLVGLGCGTGMKEAELSAARLKENGRDVLFSAVDVSRELVTESAEKVAVAGGVAGRSLICDLAQVDFLREWLARTNDDTPRLATFFGLVPNFAPPLVPKLFRAVLRPGDVLLVNAHLAPVSDGLDLPDAMRRVLPQYDNPDTLAWLSATLEQWKLAERVDAAEMTIGEVEGIPAFIARAQWKSGEPTEPLQIFRSMRYTPALFEELLRREGFQFERLATTSCREEAIWAVRV